MPFIDDLTIGRRGDVGTTSRRGGTRTNCDGPLFERDGIAGFMLLLLLLVRRSVPIGERDEYGSVGGGRLMAPPR